MREYGRVPLKFWREWGKKLRPLGPDVCLLALYLKTCPMSTMTGLYYLPLPTLCHETGLTHEGALKALRSLSDLHFAFYDHEQEVVWVPLMAVDEVGENLIPKDRRHTGVLRELEKFKDSRFLVEFYAIYAEDYQLGPCPFEAPCKPLRSQDQDQGHLQEQEQQQPPAGAREAGTEGEAAPSRPLAPAAPPAPGAAAPTPREAAPPTETAKPRRFKGGDFQALWMSALKKTPGHQHLWIPLAERVTGAAQLLAPPQDPAQYARQLVEALPQLLARFKAIGWKAPALTVKAFDEHFERLEDWVAGRKPEAGDQQRPPMRPQPPPAEKVITSQGLDRWDKPPDGTFDQLHALVPGGSST